ncbi:hypothetical protein [Pannonibacter sp. SL95]|uniref:hypothetical protein n=1 Tax=Pannonibacter sp. SL95 TaxID=2995153 RepID=UPI00227466A3|nr:hypothetical protein [Pannonibacter sp. SL95]MCY1708413.1 hypothetical protein [Pannonibacter sp. SL95]
MSQAILAAMHDLHSNISFGGGGDTGGGSSGGSSSHEKSDRTSQYKGEIQAQIDRVQDRAWGQSGMGALVGDAVAGPGGAVVGGAIGYYDSFYGNELGGKGDLGPR